jgi:hypothetical protein
LAEAGFARRSQSAGRLGNPPRVSIKTGQPADASEPGAECLHVLDDD